MGRKVLMRFILDKNLAQDVRPCLISVVVPCYNEEEVLEQTIDRLLAFATTVETKDVEFVFVDDGSKAIRSR